MLHKARCSCPNCYIGRPQISCRPDPKCREATPILPAIPCKTDSDCPSDKACDRGLAECRDPCQLGPVICEDNKKCEVRARRPVCVCRAGFVVNESGELACAPEDAQCTTNDECASNLACIKGECRDPCITPHKDNPICSSDKTCHVLDHKPICLCLKGCSPALSICLRDAGCPPGLACKNFKCENPCDGVKCPDGTPCYVEDHKPVCKFCPPGFVSDAKQGCLKGKGITLSNTRFCIINSTYQRIFQISTIYINIYKYI